MSTAATGKISGSTGGIWYLARDAAWDSEERRERRERAKKKRDKKREKKEAR